jgi:hypothetical protein
MAIIENPLFISSSGLTTTLGFGFGVDRYKDDVPKCTVQNDRIVGVSWYCSENEKRVEVMPSFEKLRSITALPTPDMKHMIVVLCVGRESVIYPNNAFIYDVRGNHVNTLIAPNKKLISTENIYWYQSDPEKMLVAFEEDYGFYTQEFTFSTVDFKVDLPKVARRRL